MAVTVSSLRALFPTGLTLVAVSSDYSSWGLTLIKILRQEQVLVEVLTQGTLDFRYFQKHKVKASRGKNVALLLQLYSISHNLLPLLPL